MFAKMILPFLGGAANVWITAMMFYQITLLLGYGYAHLSSALTLRRQWLLHAALTVCAAFALPVAIPLGWAPPPQGNPALALAGMMALAIGGPFAILSATAPLIQRWFTAARPKDDPYVLYAVSNAGSFAALIAYPLMFEPRLTLHAQTSLWSVGYALLAAAMAGAGWWALNSAAAPGGGAAAVADAGEAISWRLMGRWLVLAAIPSSLMLSTTSFIATDVASIPLLWVVPLGLYLATFIVAFSNKSASAGRFAAWIYPMLLAPLCISLVFVLGKSNPNDAMTLPLHLAAFFFAALVCHCELSRSKPDASRLTLFFFVVSCGGALGGIFNSLVAPALFSDILEYPIGLALACAVLPASGVKISARTLAAVLAAGAAAAAAEWIPEPPDPSDLRYVLEYKSLLAIGAVLLMTVRRSPPALASAVGLYLTSAIIVPSSTSLIFAERNFYGVNRVRESPQTGLRLMEHGTTVHGLMALDAAHRHTPLGYYNPAGGIAEAAFALGRAVAQPAFAVVGLGAGQMVCNGERGWRYDFYEIDPGVAQIATNKSLFPFLEECPARHSLVLGDGRLMLRCAQDGAYDGIILDAFTSDSIPLHLLTRNALDEYFRKLKPGGLLVLHLSNRYFNLAPVIAAEARDLGVFGAARLHDGGVVPGTRLSIYGSLVVALARSPEALAPLFDIGWNRLKPVPGYEAWTDDWSDLLSTLKLPGRAWEPPWETPPPKGGVGARAELTP
jgi:spermidine synthase